MQEKIAKSSIIVSLKNFKFMANKTEKVFTTFMDFDSPEAKKVLEEKKALEFPSFTTATGKCKLHRLIKWEQCTYKGRDMEIPVIAATNSAGEEKQVELAKLFGREKTFIVDRESGNYKKGEKYQINNLVEWSPELKGSTSARNAAIMAAVQDNMEINLITLWGHYEDSERSFNLTFVESGAKKL